MKIRSKEDTHFSDVDLLLLFLFKSVETQILLEQGNLISISFPPLKGSISKSLKTLFISFWHGRQWSLLFKQELFPLIKALNFQSVFLMYQLNNQTLYWFISQYLWYFSHITIVNYLLHCLNSLCLLNKVFETLLGNSLHKILIKDLRRFL